MTYDTFPNSRVFTWNKLISSLFVLFLVPSGCISSSILSQSLSWSSCLLPRRWGSLEGYTRRSRQSVFSMEPSQHSGPYCSLPTGFDHIKTWYRLILSEEEETSPITHRGYPWSLSPWVQWSIFRVYISCRCESFLSALVGRRLASRETISRHFLVIFYPPGGISIIIQTL